MADPLEIETETGVINQVAGTNWVLYLGDCCRVMRGLQDESVHHTVTSLPFSNLYVYSESKADLGNSSDHDQFFAHFRFVISELFRATVDGGICSIHCKDLPTYKGRDGSAGLYDFPGDIIRNFVELGWAYHSRVTIWKDPVIEMQRTKNHGLLYKNLRADSRNSRMGMADYMLMFRKWPKGEDLSLVSFPAPVIHTREEFPLEQWQRWASPVWDDIRQTRVLNYEMSRDNSDERHICPLQLDVIERSISLYSNPGDVILDPFNGIGSTGFVALQMKRKYVGIELKESYFEWAARYLSQAETEAAVPNLFEQEKTY